MRVSNLSTLALALLASASAALAGPLSFASDANGNLFTVDLGSGTASVVGSFGLGRVLMEGLALSPGGQLFGTDSNGNLYSINRSTGAAALIGTTGRSDIEGLDFNGSTLLGINFQTGAPTIFSIDTNTAVTTDVITATSSPGIVRSMAVSDSNDVIVFGGNNDPTISSINLSTGVVSAIGVIPTNGGEMTGADFLSDGQLYGLDTQGQAYRIDPVGGTFFNLGGTTGNPLFLDMTTVDSVPEPASLCLIGAGFVGLALLRRRKR